MDRTAQSTKTSNAGRHQCLRLAVLLAFACATAPLHAAPDDMVALAGGTFTMGSDQGLPDERPAHRVTVARFAIDRLPVTNAQFAAFLERIGGTNNERGQLLFDADDRDARIHRTEGHWRADPGFENHPVIEASWYGARDYCAALGKRLPSEAEWEFVARGTQGRTYPWGDAPPDSTRARFGVGYSDIVPVGSYPNGATPDGVLDLAGNVHEWTASIAAAYPYRADDGREDSDRFADRVTRGGAADTRADTLRASWRGATVSRGARAGHHNIGFRCAKDAE